MRPDFAPHVKGLELPGYEPRALQTMALGFAVGTRGADHNRSGAYEADFSARADRLHGSAESAAPGRRDGRPGRPDRLADPVQVPPRRLRRPLRRVAPNCCRLVTGWDVTADELRQTARRIVTAKKLFNVREGWTPAEDTLPRARCSPRALPAGTRPRRPSFPAERLRDMIAAYYHDRGWTSDGQVPGSLVADLGLEDLARFRTGAT